ncbi:MAG: RDD family protein [Verrucomicrobia bacterium]|nr:RDD family protein [Verrucomicrobiota bacterium]
MSYEEKYTVSKRGKEEGPYTALEIVDLLRQKAISTIHKVKVKQDWMSVSDFVEKHEQGELPEQNIEKDFEEIEKEASVAQKAAEAEKKPEPEPEPIKVPVPGPADEISVNRSGQPFGPYLLPEVKDYLKSGNLRFSDMVWFQGLPEWVPLSSIPGISDGIKGLGAAAPPPPKPPPAPVGAPPAPPSITGPVAAPAKPAREQREFEPLTVVEGGDDPETAGLAEHGPRALAALIDWGILGVAVCILWLIAFVATNAHLGFWLLELVTMWGVLAILGWIYFALTESSKAMASLGQRVAKIQIVNAQDHSKIGFGRASARALLKSLFAITILLPFIVFVSRRRQGLHDLACGTVARAKPMDDPMAISGPEDAEENED